MIHGAFPLKEIDRIQNLLETVNGVKLQKLLKEPVENEDIYDKDETDIE